MTFASCVLVDEETMSADRGGVSGGVERLEVNGVAEVTSIHTHISDDLTEEERKAAEEAERLKEPFRIFTKESLERLERDEEERKLKEANKDEDEGRLVDGEIVFDEDVTAKMDKNPKLADGQSLPENMGRFPKELLGIPIEEIDPYIKVKVSSSQQHLSVTPYLGAYIG